MRRATVRDVARLAGVAPITVSRVANHSPHVAEATARRVRTAMAELGFRYNQSARNLRRGEAFTTVGLLIDDLANPFYAAVGRAVEDVAREHHALLVVSSCGEDPERERQAVITLRDRGIDGMVIYPATGEHAYLQEDVLEKRPLVFLGREPREVEADSVVADNAEGARHAVAHLIAHGHRRIGAIGYGRQGMHTGYPTAGLGRVGGYRRAVADAGIPDDPTLVRMGCVDADQAATATRELLALPDPPTALFTMNNRMTVGALRALGSGLSGIALVGFDDFELADVFSPPVTVVRQDPYQMGRRAAEMLFSRLAGDDQPPEQVILPLTLVARGSGELPPASR